jgi:1-acyl-sn-glycerol-3-phosphate acyltransferase
MIKNSWIFYFCRFLCALTFRSVWRSSVYGQENIPPAGGVIIAPNHVSVVDPPLVGSSMRRPLFFMAKKELFDIPVLGFIISRTNAFPVRRGYSDITAIRTAEQLLGAGECLLVFPEGTRSKDGGFGVARSGCGMLACHTQKPVVPTRVFNTFFLGRFRKVFVVFGPPLYPPRECTKESYQQFSAQVLEAVKKLDVPGRR